MINRNATRRGISLTVAILAATIFLGVLMGVLFRTAQVGARYGSDGLRDRQCRYAAYGAIERAFGELDRDPDWRAGWPTPEQMVQNPDISYKLTVRTDVPFATLSPNEIYLFSQGYYKGESGRALAAMGGTAFRPGGNFTESAYADRMLNLMDGSTSDGFDSRIGDHWYNPAETDDAKKTLVAKSGHVGGSENVTLDTSTVDGDVILPQPSSYQVLGGTQGQQGALNLLGSASYTGDVYEPNRPRDLPDLSAPFDDSLAIDVIDATNFVSLPADTDSTPMLSPGAYASVSIPSGQTVRLFPGEYYFKDSLSLDNATLQIGGTGDVKIFVGQQMTVINSTVNPSAVDPANKNKKPRNLQILFSGEVAQLNIDDSWVSCAVIGRELQANVSRSEFFGSLNAADAIINNSNLHYDKDLASLNVSGFAKWELRGLTNLPPGTAL